MKLAQVIVGRVYEVRVSGALTLLRVDRRFEQSKYCYSRSGPGTYKAVIMFSCTNLRTGRTIALRASRLRREVQSDMARHFDALTGRPAPEGMVGGFVRTDGE